MQPGPDVQTNQCANYSCMQGVGCDVLLHQYPGVFQVWISRQHVSVSQTRLAKDKGVWHWELYEQQRTSNIIVCGIRWYSGELNGLMMKIICIVLYIVFKIWSASYLARVTARPAHSRPNNHKHKSKQCFWNEPAATKWISLIIEINQPQSVELLKLWWFCYPHTEWQRGWGIWSSLLLLFGQRFEAISQTQVASQPCQVASQTCQACWSDQAVFMCYIHTK